MVCPWVVFCVCLLLPLAAPVDATKDLEGTSVDETRGFELRHFQLVRPYPNSAQWDLYGHAFVSSTRVTLTKDEGSQFGAMWSKTPVNIPDWELQVSVRISTVKKWAADGLALWYSKTRGKSGPLWGNEAQFSGIGVVLDTYNNTRTTQTEAKRLFVVFNDGQMVGSAEDDGAEMRVHGAFGGCAPSNVVMKTAPSAYEQRQIRIMIRYVLNRMEVYYATMDENTWTLCESLRNLYLPLNYYIGISAQTGDVSSMHELISVKMYQLEAGQHSTLNKNEDPMFLDDVTKESFENQEEESSFVWYVVKVLLLCGVMVGIFLVAAFFYSQFNRTSRNRFY